MTTWIDTEKATIARAEEMLAARISGAPIYVRWYRVDRTGRERTAYYSTCTLEGVTAKRLRVRELLGKAFTADPNRCYFATRRTA